MVEITAFFVGSVFLAGVLMFLAPCTLPLVPAYLAFISGVSQKELESKDGGRAARKKIIKNSLAFVFGFSVVFIILGALVGFIGGIVVEFKSILSQIGGLIIVLFGLMMLGAIKLSFLERSRSLPVAQLFTPGTPISAFGIGATFALGWTPCIGPILASVLFLASSADTVLVSVLLLGVFSLGLAVPFILTALLYDSVRAYFTRFASAMVWVQYVGGIFLIIVGGLLLFGSFGLTVEYGNKLFNFLGIEELFDFL